MSCDLQKWLYLKQSLSLDTQQAITFTSIFLALSIFSFSELEQCVPAHWAVSEPLSLTIVIFKSLTRDLWLASYLRYYGFTFFLLVEFCLVGIWAWCVLSPLFSVCGFKPLEALTAAKNHLLIIRKVVLSYCPNNFRKIFL